MPLIFPKPTLKDRQRWYLWRDDKPLEEIAARERVSVEAIQRSIDKVQQQRYVVSVEEVDLAYNQMALELVEEQKKVLKDAMQATRWRTMPDGKQIDVADYATQLKAVEISKDLVATARPKVPTTQVNVQQNVANGVNGSGGSISFESQLREIRARRGMDQIGQSQGLLLEAEKPSQSEILAAEFEDAGIDLEEGDLEELDGEEEEENDE